MSDYVAELTKSRRKHGVTTLVLAAAMLVIGMRSHSEFEMYIFYFLAFVDLIKGLCLYLGNLDA